MYTQFYNNEKDWNASPEKKERDAILNKTNHLGASNNSILPLEAFGLMKEVLGKIKTQQLDVENKDVVLVLGETGAGKSTTIARLMGARMEEFVDEVGEKKLKIADNRQGYPVIGQDVVSQTLIPEIFALNNGEVWAVDCAGFSDNRGLIQALVGLLCIEYIVSRAKSIKGILNIVKYDARDNKLGFFVTHGVKQVKKLFPELDAHSIESMLFLLTKVPDTFLKPGFIKQIKKVKELELAKTSDMRLPETGIGGRADARQNADVLQLIEDQADRLWAPNILDKSLSAQNGFKNSSELLEQMKQFRGISKDKIRFDKAIPEMEMLRTVLFFIADKFAYWLIKCAELEAGNKKIRENIKNMEQANQKLHMESLSRLSNIEHEIVKVMAEIQIRNTHMFTMRFVGVRLHINSVHLNNHIQATTNSLNNKLNELKIQKALMISTIEEQFKKFETEKHDLLLIYQRNEIEISKYHFWLHHSRDEIAFLGWLFSNIKALEPSPQLKSSKSFLFASDMNFFKMPQPQTEKSYVRITHTFF